MTSNENIEGGAVSAVAEEHIRSMLLSMQQNMKNSKEINTLDPMPLDNQEFSHRLSGLTINVAVTDVKLIGLSNFTIEDIKMNVQTLCVNINLSYDSLALIGTYDFKGKLVKIIPLSGQGPFTVTTAHPKVRLKARLKEQEGQVQVSTLISELFLQGVKSRLSQLTGGALVSRVVDGTLTEMLHREKSRLASEISAIIKILFNNELKKFPSGLSLQLLQTSDKYIRRGSLY